MGKYYDPEPKLHSQTNLRGDICDNCDAKIPPKKDKIVDNNGGIFCSEKCAREAGN